MKSGVNLNVDHGGLSAAIGQKNPVRGKSEDKPLYFAGSDYRGNFARG